MSKNLRYRSNICPGSLVVTFWALGLFLTTGCAGRMARPDQTNGAQEPTPVAQASPQADPRMSPAAMSARLEALEAKLAEMNEKLDATRNSLDNFLTAHAPRSTGVSNSPSEAAGTPLMDESPRAPGFIQDGAVQLYRKANILFESQKYPEANLTYSEFLEKYPDHPLAGDAQFHLGEGYFKQREYKEAVEEFQKVLTSYDRCSSVAATLRDLMEAEENLGKMQEAARYRQQLLSLFPSSPAAQNLATAQSPEAPSALPPYDMKSQQESVTPVHPPSTTSTPTTSGGLDQPPPTAPLNEKSGMGQ